MLLDISDITNDFPDYQVAGIVARGMNIPVERPAALNEEIRERETEARERWQGMELSQIPGIAVWRKAYRAFGIKKTSYRCSVERLVKNVLAERALAGINGFVDAYNAVSLKAVMPAGADDLDKLKGDIAFRYAREGDSFIPLGREDAENDPPKVGEVVYADAEKVLCRRWNWYQDVRSPVTPETERAIITIQANGWGDLNGAIADLTQLMESHCGASVAAVVASASQPVVELPE